MLTPWLGLRPRRRRFPLSPRPCGQGTDLAALPAPERTHFVPIGIVVFLEFLTELAQRIAARTRIPGLSDEDRLLQHRVGLDLLEHFRIGVEARIAAKNRTQIEAEAGDPHLFDPVAQAFDDGVAAPPVIAAQGVAVPVSLTRYFFPSTSTQR